MVRPIGLKPATATIARRTGGIQMAKLINLRQFKKARARQDKAETGQRNRIKFGRSAAEKQAADLDRNREITFLDGNHKDTPHDSGE